MHQCGQPFGGSLSRTRHIRPDNHRNVLRVFETVVSYQIRRSTPKKTRLVRKIEQAGGSIG
jgi:hypothetical protein